MERREFLHGIVGVGVAAALPLQDNVRVPNSAGTDRPTLTLPAGACDCHHHIYDAERFPPRPGEMPFIPNARVEEYLLLRHRIGTTRSIVVQPASYADDNRVTLDAVAKMAPNARGVGVATPALTDAALQQMDAGGLRGLRFSVNDPRNRVVTLDMIEPLAKRIAPLGWHVQINMTADQIVDAAALLGRLPTPIVFDHMGNLPPARRANHPAFGVILRLVDKGNSWVKLSQSLGNTDGPPYADLVESGQAYVKAAPDRLVWGSNWPHPTDRNIPDDAVLVDLLLQWVPDERLRHRILVENPEALYGFAGA